MDGPKSILVTGGAGFIGSHMVESLLTQGHKVICVDNFTSETYPAAIKWKNVEHLLRHPGFTLIRGDLRDKNVVKEVFSRYHFDVIAHLAGMAGVRLSVERPHLYEEVNINATINLLEESSRACPERFIFASSSSVYGNGHAGPSREDQPVSPISPYGASKAAAEVFCQTYHRLYSLPMTILRFFTVYGPGQRPDMAIHKFTRAIDQGEPICLFGNGGSRRDYTYIDDIVDGLQQSISTSGNGCRTFNLGSGRPIPLMTMVELVEKSLGKKAKITQAAAHPADVEATLADISQAHEALGYTPHVSMEEGVWRFVRWYVSCAS